MFARYDEDGKIYEAKIIGRQGNKYLIKFIGYEGEPPQLTEECNVFQSKEEPGASTQIQKSAEKHTIQKAANPAGNEQDVVKSSKPSASALRSVDQGTVRQSAQIKSRTRPSTSDEKFDIGCDVVPGLAVPNARGNFELKASFAGNEADYNFMRLQSKIRNQEDCAKKKSTSGVDENSKKFSLSSASRNPCHGLRDVCDVSAAAVLQAPCLAAVSQSTYSSQSSEKLTFGKSLHQDCLGSGKKAEPEISKYKFEPQVSAFESKIPVQSKEALNRLVETLWFDAAQQRRHVSVQTVVQNLLMFLGIRRFEDLRVGRIADLEALRRLADLEDYINTFINSFLARRCVCTLHELDISLAKSKGKSTYEELCMGSLLKHPIIAREFQPPGHITVIPKITVLDCAKAIDDILMDRKRSKEQSIQPKDIVDVLMSKKGISDPHELCVRIKGIGLYIAQLSSCGRNEREQVQGLITRLVHEANQQFSEITEKIKDQLGKRIQLLADDEAQFESKIKEVLKNPTLEARWANIILSIFQHILENMNPFLKSLQTLKTKAKDTPIVKAAQKASKSIKRSRDLEELERMVESMHDDNVEVQFEIVEEAAALFKQSALGRAVWGTFQRSVFQSVDCDLSKVVDPEILISKLNLVLDGKAPSEHAKKAVPNQSSTLIRSRIVTNLQFKPSITSVQDMRNLECEIIQDLAVESFESMGKGSFLNFVSSDGSLSQIFDEKLHIITSWSIDKEECMEVISQASRAVRDVEGLTARRDTIISAVRQHLKIPQSSYETIKDTALSLVDEYAKSDEFELLMNTCPEGNNCPVLFISSFLSGSAEHSLTAASECVHKDELVYLNQLAKQSLTNAPFLVNLSEWMCWNALFEPMLGSLTGFLRTHMQAQVFGLQLSDGSIIRLSQTASNKTFMSALAANNGFLAAVELVSFACMHDGILRIPLPLLEASAAAGLGSLVLAGGEKRAARCVVEALSSIPGCFRSLLGWPILICQFEKAIGKDKHHCYMLLWESTLGDVRLGHVLQLLGLQHQVRAWTSNLKIIPAAECTNTDTKQECNFSSLCTAATSVHDCFAVEEDFKVPNFPEALLDIVDHVSEADMDEARHSALQLIEDIRVTEFGIGMALDSAGAALREALNARTGRALQRLSTELYSSDSHFLLELIQNADDNMYHDQVAPELLLIRGNHYILVANNELGFQSQDIRALCDIGRSTKVKRTGYIGQKGIGFKSVFRITNRPQIHSNGFSISFDVEKHGNLGYILPTWIGKEALTDVLHTELDFDFDLRRWMTVIVLPLKDSTEVDKLFSGLSPKLLLFLKQLKKLTLVDMSRSETTVFSRRDLGKDVVEVRCNDDSSKYLAVTRTIQPQIPRLDVHVESTFVTIAIPVPEARDYAYEQEDVFAYLPVRSYGFRFVLQADFILPSSREAIDRDSSWNQILCAEIPGTFADAVMAAKMLFEDPVKSANTWLAVLPMENEVQDIFHSSVRAIQSMVKTLSCIPSSELTLEQPSKVLTCTDSVRDLVDTGKLNSHLGLRLAHPNLLRKPLSALGVQALGVSVIMDLVKSGAYKAQDQLKAIVAWLAESFAEGRMKVAEQARLKELPMLTLENGALAAACEGRVFFPPSESNRESATVVQCAEMSSLNLSALFRILDPKMYRNADGKDSKYVIDFLKFVGVANLNLDFIINDHIVPGFTNRTATEDHETILRLSTLACATWKCLSQVSTKDPLSNFIKILRDCVLIWTNKRAIRCSSEMSLHFTPEYESNIDPTLFNCLVALDWNFVSGAYLRIKTKNLEVKDWRNFFKLFGVTDFITVSNRFKKVDMKSSDGNLWAPHLSHLVNDEDVLELEDFECEELSNLFKQTAEAANRYEIHVSVAKYLNDNWAEENIHVKFKAKVIGKDCEVPSSFLQVLQSVAWLPSCETNRTMIPSELWGKSESVYNLFKGLYIPYVHTSLKNQEFLQHLGAHCEPTVWAVLRELKKWSSMESFTAETSDMARIYAYFSSFFNTCSQLIPSQVSLAHSTSKFRSVETEREIQKQFLNEKLVFLPSKVCQNVHGKEDGSGNFWHLSSLCLTDPTRTVESYPIQLRSLCAHYRKENNFNPERNALPYPIRRTPSFRDYMEVMGLISQQGPVSEKVLNHCNAIFSIWFSEINQGTITAEEWNVRISYIRPAKIFPTSRNSWASIDQGIIICDDDKLGCMFDKFERVQFLHTELCKETSSCRNFFSVCNIPVFSQTVQSNVVLSQIYPDSTLVHIVQKIIPIMQHWVFWKQPELYETVAHSIEPRLSSFRVFLADEVIQRYNLYGFESDPISCAVALEGNNLFVAKSCADHYEQLFKEMSRLFYNGLTDQNFATRATMFTLLMLSKEITESVMEQHGCFNLFPCSVAAVAAMGDRQPPRIQWRMANVTDFVNEIDSKMHDFANIDVVTQSSEEKRSSQKNRDVKMWPPPKPLQNDMEKKSFEISEGASNKVTMDPRPLANDQTPGNPKSASGKGDKSCSVTDPDSSSCSPSVKTHEDSDKSKPRAESSSFSSTAQGVETLTSNPDNNEYENSAVSTSESCGPRSFGTRPPTTGQNGEPRVNGSKLYDWNRLFRQPVGEMDISVIEFPLTDGDHSANYQVEKCLLSPEDLKGIGRYGEALVVDYLLQNVPPNVEIEWMNQHEESGESYDVCVRERNGEALVRTDFIEIKTTSQSKDFFEVSHGELHAAQAHGPHFHIYRLYLPPPAVGALAAAAGGEDPGAGSLRLVRLSNPVALWRAGRVKVMMAF